MSKKIIDAKKDKGGNIEKVKLKGNKNYTSVDVAVGMAEKGNIDNAHVVKKSTGKKFLRTNPDSQQKNNLGDMANS